MIHKLLLAALVVVSVIIPAATSNAQISVEIGDRGYYTHGRSYWDHGYEYVWIPGHWGPHHRWIHGHYNRRGRWHGPDAHIHIN